MTITTRHNVMAILGSFAKDIFEYNRWLSDPFCPVNCEACHLGGRKFWSQVGCNVSPPHSRRDQELSSPRLSPPEALLPPGWLTLLQHWVLSRQPVVQRWGCRDDDGGGLPTKTKWSWRWRWWRWVVYHSLWFVHPRPTHSQLSADSCRSGALERMNH